MPGKSAAISHQRDCRVTGRVVPFIHYPFGQRRDITLLALCATQRLPLVLGSHDQRLSRELDQCRRLIQKAAGAIWSSRRDDCLNSETFTFSNYDNARARKEIFEREPHYVGFSQMIRDAVLRQ
jgi:hypothetical protein